jgi:hypothetical protein
MQTQWPRFDGMGFEYAAVSLNRHDKNARAPEAFGPICLLESTETDIDALYWWKLSETPSAEMRFHGPAANFRLSLPAGGGSWPMKKIRDWPGALGLWECTCKKSRHWANACILLREYSLANKIIKIEQPVPPIGNVVDLQFSNPVAGTDLAMISGRLDDCIGKLFDKFADRFCVPPHRMAKHKFCFHTQTRPLCTTMRATMETPLRTVLGLAPLAAGSKSKLPAEIDVAELADVKNAKHEVTTPADGSIKDRLTVIEGVIKDRQHRHMYNIEAEIVYSEIYADDTSSYESQSESHSPSNAEEVSESPIKRTRVE